MERVSIHTDEIQLDQFLKFSGAVSTGGEVKSLVSGGMIKVNGKVETARRKKLHAGDIVELASDGGSESFEVARGG